MLTDLIKSLYIETTLSIFTFDILELNCVDIIIILLF